MNILSVHPGTDTAGQSMAAKPYLEAAGDEVRVFVSRPHEFGYPTDGVFSLKTMKRDHYLEALRESYRWADVVIIHNDPQIFGTFANGPRKPELIVYHHGSRFRNKPDRKWAQAEAIGARQIFSTVDLLEVVPPGKPATWHGQIVDMAKMATVEPALPPAEGGRLRVSHAPTNLAIKGTLPIKRAMREVAADFLIIQNKKWDACLGLKASSDVFVDQLFLGYGNNAIEAWALGLPVIAGASDPVLARMRKEYRGPVPFFQTGVKTVGEDIRRLLGSPELRKEWADRGLRHVRKFHAPEAWVKRARRIYAGEPAADLVA